MYSKQIKQITEAIKDSKSFLLLGDYDINVFDKNLETLSQELNLKFISENSLATKILADDGGVLIPARYDFTGKYQGKSFLLKWTVELLDNPAEKYLLFIDFIDYSNMENLNWIKSVLNHSICGKNIENYIVGAHAFGDKDTEFNRELFSCFDTIIKI